MVALNMDEESGRARKIVVKKHRVPHWSQEDRLQLLELVAEDKETILCQKKTTAVLQQKKSAWNRIADVLPNCTSGVKRNWKQVKKCWENISTASRKNISAFKTENGKMGGDKSHVQLTPEDVMVLQIYGHEVYSGESIGFNSGNMEVILLEKSTKPQTPPPKSPTPLSHRKKRRIDTDGSTSSLFPPVTRPIPDELSRKEQLACDVLELEKEKLKAEIDYLKAATKAQEAISTNNIWQERKARYELAEILKRDPTLHPVEEIASIQYENEIVPGSS